MKYFRILILAFVLFFSSNTAFAVWTPIQNVEEYPFFNAQAASGGDTQVVGMWFQATSTFSVQEISFRMCKIGASTGSMYVVLATGTAATFTQIATSTGYDISQLNACSGAGTSTMAYANFSWDGNVYQFLEDEYVGIYIVVPSGTGDYFIHTFNRSYEAFDYWGRDTASTSWRQCRYWNFNTSGCVGNGTPQSIFFQISTAGQAPIYAAYYNPVIENYEECDSAIDIGCHLSNAAVWLFYPTATEQILGDIFDTNFASTVPVVYLIETKQVFNTMFNQTATTSMGGFNLSVAPLGLSTTTIYIPEMSEVVDLDTVSLFASIREHAKIFLWLMFLYAVLKFALTALGLAGVLGVEKEVVKGVGVYRAFKDL